ncbi:hypothetical protein Gotur_023519 [Gossypium turneri]
MKILVQTGLKKLCLTNRVLQKVLMEKTSSALWKRVETLYATKSLANHLVLKQRLFTFHMNEGELLRDQINQFITLLNDLKNVEVKVDVKIKLCYYCVLYPLHTSILERL